jgi:hypothetical protein
MFFLTSLVISEFHCSVGRQMSLTSHYISNLKFSIWSKNPESSPTSPSWLRQPPSSLFFSYISVLSSPEVLYYLLCQDLYFCLLWDALLYCPGSLACMLQFSA